MKECACATLTLLAFSFLGTACGEKQAPEAASSVQASRQASHAATPSTGPAASETPTP
jgi:hypothetical protein